MLPNLINRFYFHITEIQSTVLQVATAFNNLSREKRNIANEIPERARFDCCCMCISTLKKLRY